MSSVNTPTFLRDCKHNLDLEMYVPCLFVQNLIYYYHYKSLHKKMGTSKSLVKKPNMSDLTDY